MERLNPAKKRKKKNSKKDKALKVTPAMRQRYKQTVDLGLLVKDSDEPEEYAKLQFTSVTAIGK